MILPETYENSEREADKFLDPAYAAGFKDGMKHAMTIAEDFEHGGDDGCRCASMIMQAIEQEIK
jgi:hypothetical protein